MKIKMYQIDAFAQKAFQGNPAAVCILSEWIADELMQNIAAENNLAETAFVVKADDQFDIKWFTPTTEVDLCGHATLASAFVLFQYYENDLKTIKFHSHKSGPLRVVLKESGEMTMDFPTDVLNEVSVNSIWKESVGILPDKVLKGKTDYLLIYPNQETVENITPSIHELNKIPCRGVIVSAPGRNHDFISRFFAPQVGVDEDPVTGSAHTTLIPYWSQELSKNELTAIQLSKRTGELNCEYLGERVKISGYAVPYLVGEINV